MFRILADLSAMAHIFWLVFLVVGGFWGTRIRWVRILHLGGLAVTMFLTLSSLFSPFIFLEVWLRAKVEAGTFPGSMVLRYRDNLQPLTFFYATALLYLFNAWVYLRADGQYVEAVKDTRFTTARKAPLTKGRSRL